MSKNVRRRDFLQLAIGGAVFGTFLSTAFSQPPAPKAGGDVVPLMLRIEWSRGTNLPQGFQDSDGGILGDQLITVGGFCSGGLKEDNRRKPGRYPRGFLNKAWRLRLNSSRQGWERLPDLPGAPRQALSAARVDEALYFWGGFSYTKPFCYSDGWKLERINGTWRWQRLPDFPHSINSIALSVVGKRVFAFGGSDYDGKAFFTETDRHAGCRAWVRGCLCSTRPNQKTVGKNCLRVQVHLVGFIPWRHIAANATSSVEPTEVTWSTASTTVTVRLWTIGVMTLRRPSGRGWQICSSPAATFLAQHKTSFTTAISCCRAGISIRMYLM